MLRDEFVAFSDKFINQRRQSWLESLAAISAYEQIIPGGKENM